MIVLLRRTLHLHCTGQQDKFSKKPSPSKKSIHYFNLTKQKTSMLPLRHPQNHRCFFCWYHDRMVRLLGFSVCWLKPSAPSFPWRQSYCCAAQYACHICCRFYRQAIWCTCLGRLEILWEEIYFPAYPYYHGSFHFPYRLWCPTIKSIGIATPLLFLC